MNKIPKVIHYCWFGKSPKSELAIKCIESWKKYCPEYEIIEWNESNFDITCNQYVKEAYAAKKWAFVSDYARFYILYNYGGVYFDTDVELLKSIDDLIEEYGFMGYEKENQVNPGLGMAFQPKHILCKQILDEYSKLKFILDDGSYNFTTVVTITTKILDAYDRLDGLENQNIMDIILYSPKYFSPKDIDSHKINITNKTYSIHHYDASWAEVYDKRAGDRIIVLRKIFGNKLGGRVNSIIYAYQRFGIKECIVRIKEGIKKEKK